MGRLWSLALLPAMLLTTLWSLSGVKSHLNLFISQEEVRKLLGKYSTGICRNVYTAFAKIYCSMLVLDKRF
jgi:hypothetical protein